MEQSSSKLEEVMDFGEKIIEEPIHLAEKMILEPVIHDCEDADFVLPSDCEEELAESRKPVYDYVMVDFDILI
ncbi:unnamed protein product [Caenorhabditis brenneri]